MPSKKRKGREVSPNPELIKQTELNRIVTRLSTKEGGVSFSSPPSTTRRSPAASAFKKKGKKTVKTPDDNDDESDDETKSVSVERTSDPDYNPETGTGHVPKAPLSKAPLPKADDGDNVEGSEEAEGSEEEEDQYETHYIVQLPPEQLNPNPVFPYRFDTYPFLPIRDSSSLELLSILRDFCDGEDTFAVRPLNFTNYTLYPLQQLYRSQHLAHSPLFFLSHWASHPIKRTIDYTQKTTQKSCTTSVWRPKVTKKIWKKFDDAWRLMGFRTTWDLYDSIDGREETFANYVLYEYTLLDFRYPLPRKTNEKRTDWALFKLSWERKATSRNKSMPWVPSTVD